MNADPDEEALNWDAPSDPSYTDENSLKKPAATKPSRGATKAAAADAAGQESADDAELAPATGSFLLVSYGIIAGAFVLYAVGWVLGLGHVNSTNEDVISQAMGLASQGLAIGAPVIWFGGTFLITRKRKAITRLVLLIAGLVLTVPLPFILLGAAR